MLLLDWIKDRLLCYSYGPSILVIASCSTCWCGVRLRRLRNWSTVLIIAFCPLRLLRNRPTILVITNGSSSWRTLSCGIRLGRCRDWPPVLVVLVILWCSCSSSWRTLTGGIRLNRSSVLIVTSGSRLLLVSVIGRWLLLRHHWSPILVNA